MAYHPHHHTNREDSALGLASTHSYLDGVPFKISPAFIPSPQPELPPEYTNTSVYRKVLDEEYDFKTEEAVLAWAKALEEAKAKALAEQQAAERARAALAAAESNSSSESENEAPETQPTSTSGVTAPTSSLTQQEPVKPPWQLPVAGGGSTILTPTQAGLAKIQSPMTPKAEVDLAMFEQEGDPFDNLELQTINEMEELRTLLGSSTVQSPQSSPNPDSQVFVSAAEESFYSNLTPARPQPSVNTTQIAASAASDLYENVALTSSQTDKGLVNNIAAVDKKRNARFGVESTGDGDYVEIRPDYAQGSVSFQRDSAALYGNVGPAAGQGEDQEQYANSGALKPALPPIKPRGQSLGDGSAAAAAASGVVVTSLRTNANVGVASSGGRPNSAYVMSTSASGVLDAPRASQNQIPMYSNVSQARNASPAFSNNIYNCAPGYSVPAADNANAGRHALRSAKSNPDLSLSTTNTTNSVLSQNSSPPQPWNPYKPLPPTPVSEHRSSSSSSESLPTDHRRSPSPHPFPPCPHTRPPSQPEVDPYFSLSNESKNFVNNLTSMGFSRDRASRAVQKFGTDEREVLDHLLNVDKLVEKRFTPALAETGLQLFSNDLRKAEQFVDLYQQFTELGFTGDRIKTALVKHQLDRDKALDFLTA